jgi:membrane protease YdiL (CAAX protease family)
MEYVVLGLSIAFGFLVFALSITALVICIRNRYETADTLKYGLLLAAVVVVLDLLAIPLAPDLFADMDSALIFVLAIGSILRFIGIILLTCLGIHCTRSLGLRDVPLLRRLLTREDSSGSMVNRGYFLSSIVLAAGAIAFTAILFVAVPPYVSSTFVDLSEIEMAEYGIAEMVTPALILVVIQATIYEEILFRLCIQSFVAKYFGLNGRKYVWAVLLTAALWAVLHLGALDPVWIKFVQVFPIGIALGFLFRRYGLGSTILAHGAFNVAGMFLAVYLVNW